MPRTKLMFPPSREDSPSADQQGRRELAGPDVRFRPLARIPLLPTAKHDEQKHNPERVSALSRGFPCCRQPECGHHGRAVSCFRPLARIPLLPTNLSRAAVIQATEFVSALSRGFPCCRQACAYVGTGSPRGRFRPLARIPLLPTIRRWLPAGRRRPVSALSRGFPCCRLAPRSTTMTVTIEFPPSREDSPAADCCMACVTILAYHSFRPLARIPLLPTGASS